MLYAHQRNIDKLGTLYNRGRGIPRDFDQLPISVIYVSGQTLWFNCSITFSEVGFLGLVLFKGRTFS